MSSFRDMVGNRCRVLLSTPSYLAIPARRAMFVGTVLFTSLAWSGDISGVWKHTEEPAWIEIRLAHEGGTGTVVRNDKFPERGGRKLMQYLVADTNKPNTWHGRMYLEKMDKWADLKLQLLADGRLRSEGAVGFMSRSIDWLRASKIEK